MKIIKKNLLNNYGLVNNELHHMIIIDEVEEYLIEYENIQIYVIYNRVNNNIYEFSIQENVNNFEEVNKFFENKYDIYEKQAMNFACGDEYYRLEDKARRRIIKKIYNEIKKTIK